MHRGSSFGGESGLKVFGALLVLFSGAAIGWICGTNLRKRQRQLGEFYQFFQWLSTEVHYNAVPLREACVKIAGRIKGETALLIKRFTELLNSGQGLTGDEAWQGSIAAEREQFSLKEEDWAVLRDFGRTLGNTDRDHQVKSIAQAIECLQVQQQEAKTDADKNERIYRYLGVAAGAMVVFFIY
jgi:stage III sporulation protein AB